MKKHWLYLKYVVRHKWYVFWACLEYGLLWRGIVHDLSKFRPSEWNPYANYFYGNRQEIVNSQIDFDFAWNRHQKRNDHHWQYWLLSYDNGVTGPLPMPDNCRREMLCDWIGAGKALGKPKTWEWYEANKDNMQLHSETRAWAENEIRLLKERHRVGVMLGFEKPL